MTNDLIAQAEALLGRLAALREHAKIKPNATILETIKVRDMLLGMVPRLVAEIKQLEEIKETGPHAISIGGKTFLSVDVDENRLNQLKDKDTEITKWKQIAIKERAITLMQNEYERGTLVKHEDAMEEAAKELGLELDEKDRYTEQLEKDFIFYARSYEYLRDPDKWKPHQERYAKAEQNAQNALNEIRKRKL